MRITGGAARGIILDVPQKGEVRPATDFARERIFNCIGPLIKNAIVLDCFAGTGAYGLEALSRNAQKCLFVEQDLNVITVLKSNCIKVCKSAQRLVEASVNIFNIDVFKLNLDKIGVVDYLFFDPPYRFWETSRNKIFDFFNRIANVSPKTVLALEYPSQFIWPSDSQWQPLYPIKPSKKKNAPVINLFKIK